MSTAHVFTKTLAVGTKQVYALDTRGQYVRPAALSSNWKKIRLGVIFNLSGAAADNTSPVTESLAISPYHNDFLFGLSDGVGFPGDAGAGKFIGIRFDTYFAPNLCVGYASSKWNISKDGTADTGVRPLAIALNSNSLISNTGGVGDQTGLAMNDPTATTNNATAMVIELDCTTPGDISASYKATPNVACDDTTLTSLLSGTLVSCGTAGTGGWWSGSVPVNVTNWFIRWPLSLNRFQILNTQFEPLA